MTPLEQAVELYFMHIDILPMHLDDDDVKKVCKNLVRIYVQESITMSDIDYWLDVYNYLAKYNFEYE